MYDRSMRRLIALVSVVGACGDGGGRPAMPTQGAASFESVIVRVESVEVSPAHEGKTWDPQSAPADLGPCRLFAESVGLGAAALGTGAWAAATGQSGALVCAGFTPPKPGNG